MRIRYLLLCAALAAALAAALPLAVRAATPVPAPRAVQLPPAAPHAGRIYIQRDETGCRIWYLAEDTALRTCTP